MRECVRVCVCVCARARVRVSLLSVRACVRACVCEMNINHTSVFILLSLQIPNVSGYQTSVSRQMHAA